MLRSAARAASAARGTRGLAGLSSATQKAPLPPFPVVQGVTSVDPSAQRDVTAGLAQTLLKATTASEIPVRVAAESGTSFQVLNSGSGSVLVANVGGGDSVTTVVGTVVAMSGEMGGELTTSAPMRDAAVRRLAGGSLFFDKARLVCLDLAGSRAEADQSRLDLQFSAPASRPGVVVVAPKKLGDVAAIELDGSIDYTVRQSSLLAMTSQIEVTTEAGGFGLNDNGFFNYRVHGKGAVALTAYGGLLRLVLQPGEEFIADPKHLIAWDSSIAMAPVTGDALPQARIPTKPTLAWLGSLKMPNAVKNGAETTIQMVNTAVQFTAHKLRYWVVGQRGVYKLRGPGDVFVATRLRPMVTLPKFQSKADGSKPAPLPSTAP
ncbi:hypothetical protein HK105_208137 [Polyrhizophydium stewartii]|uniref:Altered inheritance of mitochondria protein 24, mitochondrial n=1 Tax=Polyrhizophydium stewartii TaxID=2732419 RepID=A0ABR4MYR2_9FUNG